MARRRKSKTTRRRKKTISITNTAQGLIVGNAMVKGATNANLMEFFTGRVYNPTYSDYAYFPTDADSIITLPELLGMDRPLQKLTHSETGRGYNITAREHKPTGLQLETMKENIMTNWLNMASTAVVVPVAFKLGKKVMTKAGITRGVNRAFDVVGLKEVRF
jgi:hypothetical protein